MNDTTQPKKQYPPRKPTFSAYLGPPEVSERRLKALMAMSKSLGMTRSEFVQAIADRRLLVSPNPEYTGKNR